MLVNYNIDDHYYYYYFYYYYRSPARQIAENVAEPKLCAFSPLPRHLLTASFSLSKYFCIPFYTHTIYTYNIQYIISNNLEKF